MKALIKTERRTEARKIVGIFLIWTALGIGEFFYEWSILGTGNCFIPYFDFRSFFIAQLIATLLGSMIGSVLTVKFVEGWFRTKPYWWTLVLIFLGYSLVAVAVALVSISFFYGRQFQLSFIHPAVQNAVLAFLTSSHFVRLYFFWLLVLLMTMIGLLVKDKYGPGVFSAFLLGKYFRPKREERIFMFLDLRSSTVIAERLGEALYFNFLKEVFEYATPPILRARGEIYQYVGDAIVVSWTMKNGLRKSNCVRCFYAIEMALMAKRELFRKKYDATPKFKAGLHSGFVMAGEIGAVKRDIAFTGDVLNTTSRIQGQCNELGVNLLISKQLLDRLPPDPNFHPTTMGEITLKGKQEQVTLCTV